MDQAASRFSYLFARYTEKSGTAAERNEFFSMVKKEENALELNSLISNAVGLTEAELHEIEEEKADKLFQNILSETLGGKTINMFPPKKNKRIWWAAAMAVLMLGSGAYFVLNNVGSHSIAEKNVVNDQLKHDIAPGYEGAVLTLSNGQQIILDSAGNGTLAMQGNINILKQNGKIVYDHKNISKSEVLYNTMTTPRGRQYSVVLADGTKVWLNAASSLTFPTAFTGIERRVKLKGEAYFEVAKNADMPFKVDVSGMEVKVLGTHFNIMAYDEESAFKTTLLEGSVTVAEGNMGVVLKPGEEAVMSRNGRFKVNEANVEDAIAWKNGLFQFNNAGIRFIMRKLSRWYDIEVVYQGDVEGMSFSGVVSQYTNLSQVLKMLQLTKEVNFKMDGKKVIVSP